ncbi:hypothetical protein HY640_00040 [Candidatus Woesearchaeota archaeon]|nr:hypothetical protein [Candidatus Woesearchaeota archaeon]
MTVGISVTNGLEAVIITDARVTQGARQTDAGIKAAVFNADTFGGVIFGAGNGDYIWEVLSTINGLQQDTLKETVESANALHQARVFSYYTEYLETKMREIYMKARLIQDPGQQDEFVRIKRNELMHEYDQHQQNPANRTQFAVVGFDINGSPGIKTFCFDFGRLAQCFGDTIYLGGGADASNIYLIEELQGIDTKLLRKPDLLFYALNAYALSTLNTGVGGTPTIAMVERGGARTLGHELSVVLTNLTGAYKARVPSIGLTDDETKGFIAQVVSKGLTPDVLGNLSSRLGLSPESVGSIYMPFSSWKKKANNERYPRLQ